MSTRALRKLQREQELERQLIAAKAQEEPPQAESEEELEEEKPAASTQPKNAFDLLDADDEGDHAADDDDDDISAPESTEQITTQTSTPKPSSKKRKKKAKKKAKAVTETSNTNQQTQDDEIDRALKELALKHTPDVEGSSESARQDDTATLLAVDPKHLDTVNEMRSLFGSIAVQDHRRNQQAEPNADGTLDLYTALLGKYNRATKGKSLGALAKRRNCLIQGREEWPLATAGGLSMELASSGAVKHYNILHNRQYAEQQHQFRLAVESMDPQSMISMVMNYPYHVASLLQLSEIAKHQGDSLVAGDLLERALFTFGRAVQGTFPVATKSGTARLQFQKPENRELYLAIWRYIRNLEQRGTWRTAYEWAKLLLQFDAISDPYGVTHMIDQLALRGRQHAQFLELCSDSAYGRAWSHLPNIAISKTLALLRAGQPREARKQLAIAIHHYPYVVSALASALEIAPMPKSIWGKTPNTDAEKLYTELYITKARDLWNTPETIGLISEVSNTLSYYQADIDASSRPAKLEIALEDARHIMLLEIPALIALLPRALTNMPTSSSDPLSPPDSLTADNFVQRQPGSGTDATAAGFLQGLLRTAPQLGNGGGQIFQRLLAQVAGLAQGAPRAGPDGPEAQGNDTAAEVDQETLREFRRGLGAQAQNLSDDVLLQMLLAQNMQLDDEELSAAFGTVPGGWDYYNDAEDGDSSPSYIEDDEDESRDSMPELEEIPAHVQVRPFAPTIEEAEDEDAPITNNRVLGADQPIIRHVDDLPEPVPQTQPQSTPMQAASSASRPAPAPSNEPAEDIESSPQRLQRWLIAAGLDDLKEGKNQLLYVKRLKLLHKNQQGWIVNVVKQRAGKELGDRIAAMI